MVEETAQEQQMEDVVFESLPVNVQPGEQLSEYDKRMKRAARFGIDPVQAAGPQAKAAEINMDAAMDANQAYNTMELGSAAPKVDKIQTQIERIKAR